MRNSVIGPALLALLKRPRAVLVSLALVTLLCAPLLATRLRLEGNLIDLLPRSPAAQTFATFTRSLVSGQDLIILVVCEDPQRLLSFADDYAAALRGRFPAAQVTLRVSGQSVGYLRQHLLLLLTEDEITALSPRLTDAALQAQARHLRQVLLLPGGSALAPILTADPLELLSVLRGRLSSGLSVDTETGYFRSADGTALLIKLRPGFDPMDFAADERLMKEAGAAAQALGGQVAGTPAELAAVRTTPTVAFTGSYAFPPYYRRWMEQDLKLSTAISVGAVLLLFALFFRALRILPVVMLPLLCAGVWTAAAAALLYGRINPVSLAFATILVAIGIDLPIQIYNRLREELLQATDAAAAVRATLLSLGGPAVAATLGPAAVFLCCGLSQYQGLRHLGILAALGLCLNCAAMLLMFPSLLLVLPQRWWYGAGTQRADQRRAGRPPGGLLYGLGRLGGRAPRAVLAFAGVVLVLALPSALRVRFDQELLALDPGRMPPAAAQAEIARRFGDSQRFLVALVEDEDPARAEWRADLWLRAIERLRQAGALRGYEALGTLLPSPETTRRRIEALRRLDLPRVAARLRAALLAEGFDAAPFEGFLESLRGPLRGPTKEELARTELGFLLRSHLADLPAGSDGGPGPARPARRLLATYIFAAQEGGAPAQGGAVRGLAELLQVSQTEAGGTLTGRPLLEAELLSVLRRDAVVLTSSSVGLVALLLLLFYRQVRPLVAVLVPLLLSWVLFAAALRWLDLGLNLYNLLVIPLVIGYGIDDHVFLVERHMAAAPGAREPAVTLQRTGRAVVLTSLSTMVGFGGLWPAHFPGLRSLGLCGALAVLLCLVAALLVLPALLRLLWPPPPADVS